MKQTSPSASTRTIPTMNNAYKPELRSNLPQRLIGRKRTLLSGPFAALALVLSLLSQPILQASAIVVVGTYSSVARADCNGDGDEQDADEYAECAQQPPSDVPSNSPPPADGCKRADPVDCFSGVFLHRRVDLFVGDVIPLQVVRTYRSRDTILRSFGVGTTLSYDLFMLTDYGSYFDLIQSDGSKIHYTCVGASCTPIGLAGGPFAGSVATFYPPSIRLKDGTSLAFSFYVPQNAHSAGLISIIDRFGNSALFKRDSNGNLIQAISPNGRKLTFTYDTNCANCIKQISDDIGRTVKYTYFPDGTLQSVTDPLSNTENYTYDPTTKNMLTVTDKRKNVMVTNVYYSGTGNAALDGRVKQQTYPDTSTAQFTYTFDTSNTYATQTDFTDERSVVARTQFNAAGTPISITDALNKPEQRTVTFTRDQVTNQVMTETDSLGRVTQFKYDPLGNVTQRTDMYGTAQATTWKYTWDQTYGGLTSATDPLTHTTKYIRDTFGNLIEIDDPLGNKETRTYYPNGQLWTINRYPGVPTANTVLTTTFTYQNGDLNTVSDPLARVTTLNVDAVGRVIGVRDPGSRLSTITYDALDRITQRCDPTGTCATLKYDPNDNLLQFIKGATQRDFTYDSRNRLLTEGRGTTVERTLSYPLDYLHQTTTEASGRVFAATLDSLGRAKHVDVSNGTSTVLRTLDYVYDTESRLKSVTDSVAGALSYTYDDRFDAIASETGPTGSVSYVYYANGLPQTATPSGGSTITYGFDPANRLKTITQAAGSGNALPSAALTVSIGYDTASRRQTLTLPNNVVLAYGLDNADQLNSLTWTQGANTVGNIGYGYDVLGRRNQITGSFARLNTATPVTLTVGSDGRIATENGTALQYDANGRLTQDTQYKYIWNEVGQLSQLLNPANNAVLASFKYDAKGRRIGKTIGGQTIQYLYAGDNPIVLQDGSGSPTETLLAGGVDEWFARTTGGQTQTYLTDALGSAVRLTDSNGAKLADYTYDLYGSTTNDTPSNTNLFQYTGRENDGLGLYFYRARYYKPKWGRFPTQDPIGLAGGDNLYAYAAGNPIRYRDPTGNCPWCVAAWWWYVANSEWINPLAIATIEAIAGSPNSPVSQDVSAVEQYSLRAAEDGFFPVMERGFKDATSLSWCKKGDVWKFGTTQNPGTRYSQNFLDSTGNGLAYETEFSGSLQEALTLEDMKIRNYLQQTGALPPGNKIVK